MTEVQTIRPLADFLANHEEHLARLKESRAPEILTIDGRAELVLQDANSYQQLLTRLNEIEDLMAVREGLAQADRGEGQLAEEAFAELRAKHGL